MYPYTFFQIIIYIKTLQNFFIRKAAVKNNVFICMAAMIVSIVIRCSENANHVSSLQTFILLGINIIALFVVLTSICDQIKSELKNSISLHPIRSIRECVYRDIDIKLSCFLYISFLIVVIACIKFRYYSIVGDILSIIALFLSLCDSSLASKVADKILRLLK